MIIKKCTITTEEYNIIVYSDENHNASVNVNFNNQTPSIKNMCIFNDTLFYIDYTNTINYSICHEIKCIVQDALKYYEFWEESDVEETESFINSHPYFFV